MMPSAGQLFHRTADLVNALEVTNWLAVCCFGHAPCKATESRLVYEMIMKR